MVSRLPHLYSRYRLCHTGMRQDETTIHHPLETRDADFTRTTRLV